MFKQLVENIRQVKEKAGGEWGIVLEDLQTGEEFRYQAEQPFYAASVIKVPIMAAVFQAANDGKFSLSDPLVLRREDQTTGAGVLQHMTPGTELSIYDVVTLMIIQSDNTATNMLIDLVGKKRIRELLQQLEMHETLFYNKLQVIPYPLKGSNQTSAGDCATLMKLMATQKIVSYQACEQMMDIMKKQQLNEMLPANYPDPDGEYSGMPAKWVFAHKTGMVTGIHHDVGILYRGQRGLLVSILTKGLDTIQAREAMAEIGMHLYQYLE